MAIGKHVSDNNPGGTSLGQTTTDTISFYGVTPVVQPAGTNQAAVTSTAVTAPSATVTTSTSAFGFSTSTQGDALVTAVRSLTSLVNSLTAWQNQTRTDLVSIGVQKGSV